MKMTQIVGLEVKKRNVLGKGFSKKLRSKGLIPAIVYGPEMESPVAVYVNKKFLESYLRHGNWGSMLFNLKMEDLDWGGGEEFLALIRDVQYHPVTREPLHIDFYHVTRGHKITLTVPVHIVGKENSPGVKMGGIVEQYVHELEVECLPKAIPEAIVVDISNLGLEDVIHVGELDIPEGVEVLDDPETTVVVITAPRVEEEETTEEEISAAEVPTVAETEREKEE